MEDERFQVSSHLSMCWENSAEGALQYVTGELVMSV